MSEIILVGLGVSGLACGMLLHENNIAFSAFEKETSVGGLTRSRRMDGFTFDYGPHVILSTPNLYDRLNLDLEQCSCESSIFLNIDEIISVPAPIQHNLHRLPLVHRMRTFYDIVNRNVFPLDTLPNHFEQQIISQSGKTLYKLFFHGYESKRLRFPLTEIDAGMPNRIQPPAISQLFGFSDTRNQSTCGGHDTHFKYPRRSGIDALPTAMLNTLPAEQIYYDHALFEIDLQKKLVTFTNNRKENFEYLVLSVPLPECIFLLKDAPKNLLEAAEHLIYSSIYVLNIGIEGKLPQSWGIARLPRKDVEFYRVSVPSHYSKNSVPEGCSSLTVEVAHHNHRYPLNEIDVRRRIYWGLKHLDILKSESDVNVEWLHNIPYGHIIYDQKTRSALELIFGYLTQHGIYNCGKYGEWRDMLMNHSVESGMRVAQQIVSEITKQVH